MRFRLFDLAEGTLAYAATHQQSDQNCRRNARFRGGSGAGIGAAIASALIAVSLNAAIDSAKGIYPRAPTPATLLDHASREFVAAWPGAADPSGRSAP